MTYEELGGDATGQQIGDVLFADYAEAGQAPNPGMGVWFWRTSYDCSQGLAVEQSIAKHRSEWRAALGLVPEPIPSGDLAPQAPRDYVGNMCGVRVDGVPDIGVGGPAGLLMSWFYGRYAPEVRARIRDTWRASGYVDILLSWPDDRAVGCTPSGFVAICQDLIANGFRPCVMLLSKYFNPNYDRAGCQRDLDAILPTLLQAQCVSRYCLGWELSLWLSPKDVQDLIDANYAAIVAAGRPFYVHFQQGYFSFSQEVNGESVTADFWKLNVGKLTGVWHQRHLSWATHDEYQARIVDCLERFAGNYFFPADSGFGHPFDFAALEITAQPQFDGAMDEATGDGWGRCAIETTPSYGPLGPVRVMGSGNGGHGSAPKLGAPAGGVPPRVAQVSLGQMPPFTVRPAS
jgi:hypothetical protein